MLLLLLELCGRLEFLLVYILLVLRRITCKIVSIPTYKSDKVFRQELSLTQLNFIDTVAVLFFVKIRASNHSF